MRRHLWRNQTVLKYAAVWLLILGVSASLWGF